MTIHFPEDLESSIQAVVRCGRYASPADVVTEAVRSFLRQQKLDQTEPTPASEGETAPPHKPIWEKILEISADVPEEAWDALPTDLSEQHDHYIYGVRRNA